jgi:hypothetical protein
MHGTKIKINNCSIFIQLLLQVFLFIADLIKSETSRRGRVQDGQVSKPT